jgi:hypothetical protein
MTDLYLKFTDQPEALSVMRELGMTVMVDVYAKDENGDYIYDTITYQDVEHIYDEDDEDNDEPIETRLLVDADGNPVMVESKLNVYVQEEQLSQGGHQWALWEVGEINGVEGWHVNLRIIDDTLDVSALEPYCVTPRNPRVVWG